ncbi:hypothetical protein SGM_4035 [Streptomyces griseoaurantiacus M045]|uniref:Uncharacterized protein n=1 Tax=Streptomyces griseoaurantiacus M045 TaxID=996637 RepID=F3NLM1_9ACTN|nr:hypothetical protein SGM_4035 [Streptomyces griseoaurantiacus M045]
MPHAPAGKGGHASGPPSRGPPRSSVRVCVHPSVHPFIRSVRPSAQAVRSSRPYGRGADLPH